MASTSTAACSLGARQAMADRVISAADAALRAGTFRGTMQAAVQPVKGARPAPPGPPRILPIGVSNVAVASDLRASTTWVGGDATNPELIFVGPRIFQRRGALPQQLQAAGAAGATNLVLIGGTSVHAAPSAAKPTGRAWLKLDLDHVPRTSQERTAGSLGIDPGQLIHLLRGALAGSLRTIGTEDIGGAPTTHYAMNLSRDKAGRGTSTKDRIRLEKAFLANAVTGDVSRAEVWVDASGRPRRVLVRLRQQLDADTLADLVVTLDLASFGDPVAITEPAKRDVATVSTFGQLMHGATGA